VSVRPEVFKEGLRHWASGVTIVTSRLADRTHGMTVSAFTSVSLEPPLVLVCADRSSDTYALIAQSRVFAVNVLGRHQRHLSDRFAREEDEQRRFEGLETATAVTGSPILAGALVSFDCRVVDAHDAGDHVIYVGRVEAVATAGGEPLLYHQAAYRTLAKHDG
jgi:flavin reductase (DIM6/NTAB) family NADH-FMN oxidoreductase RutF